MSGDARKDGPMKPKGDQGSKRNWRLKDRAGNRWTNELYNLRKEREQG